MGRMGLMLAIRDFSPEGRVAAIAGVKAIPALLSPGRRAITSRGSRTIISSVWEYSGIRLSLIVNVSHYPAAAMFTQPLVRLAIAAYYWLIAFITKWLQPIFLLIIRLYWGWQFHVTGMGKLSDIPKVTGFFQSLGIPFPEFNAYLAGSTECFVGLLLLLGFASRLTTIPLIITMIVAYITASPDAVKHIFSKPDDFVSADPFLFMLAAIIVFLFGPGPLSIDGLIGRYVKARTARESAPAVAVS
jgi:putative oxidoreductase